MGAAGGVDQLWNTASYRPAMEPGAVTSITDWTALGTAVWATDRAVGAAAGVPVM